MRAPMTAATRTAAHGLIRAPAGSNAKPTTHAFINRKSAKIGADH